MKKERLKSVNKKIRNCKKCFLWKTRKNAVPGEGPESARILVLGQAPGAEEDKSGRPFCGRAGKLLTSLLGIAGIKRDRVFITNPVKCFPPKNRKPSKEEIASCFPYLKEQIDVINPSKVILLGEVAFKSFFPENKLKNCRGKWLKLGKKCFFITYHPSAGLRFKRMKKILEKDFKKLKNH